MQRIARWSTHHRLVVVACWILVLVAMTGLARAAGSRYSMEFRLGDTESARALTLLQRAAPATVGASDLVVLTAPGGGDVTASAAVSPAEALIARLRTLPDVASVTDPFLPAMAMGASGRALSPDHRVAFATVTFAEQPTHVPEASVTRVITTAEAARSAALGVQLSGQDIAGYGARGGTPSTALGVALALVVLGIAFGALLATPLPIICALFSIGIGVQATVLLSHVMPMASFGTILDALIGLGVGVDYALFIVTRHRSSLRAGAGVEDSVAVSLDTAGRAVFFAAITVCIALLGQFVLGLPFLYGIAVSASITVLLTMVASLTLLPALLGLIGGRALSRRQRRALATTGPLDEALTGGWYRWARWLEGRWLLPALAATAVVIAMALPVLTLRLGLDDAGTDPPGSTTLLAYRELSAGFGPGSLAPMQLVAPLAAAGDDRGFQAALGTLRSEPGVASVSPGTVLPGGRLGVAELVPTTSPQSAATAQLVRRLRSELRGTGVLVGGQTAIQLDFVHVLAGKLVWFVAVVVVLGFLLLMAVFRSLVVPAVASVVNLLSVGAALGVMNVVFEWGWGRQLFRIPEKAPIEVFIPVMILSILFGLSMDYEVFLVSRIHEEWVRRRDTTLAVTLGQAATGRVITAAATIMVLVFASFALGDEVVIKQFGIGLAAAILVDAFLVRTVIVPAAMHALGERNWWLPGWLDRAIPHLRVEGSATATTVAT